VPVKAVEQPRKDRVFTARKVQMELQKAKEAEMETQVLDTPRTVVVVCPTCKQRTAFAVGSGVPVHICPNDGTRLSGARPGQPQVVNR
jgi:hypothetical protein